MYTKSFLISAVAVLCAVNGVLAATYTWTDGDAGDSLWCNEDNWSLEGVPGSSDTAIIDATSPNRAPIIGIACGDVSVGGITGPEPALGQTQVMDVNTSGTVQVGQWSWVEGIGTAIININGSPTITIAGDDWRGPDLGVGIVNISGDPNIIIAGDMRGADQPGSYYINMSGGRVEVGDDVAIGDYGGGEINLSGGSIIIADDFDLGGLRGTDPITVNITAGSITVGDLFFCPGSALRAGVVRVNLYGGVIDCNQFVHGGSDTENPTYTDDWRVDIEEGTLIIGGNVVAEIDANVAAGQITAYNGDGTVVIEFLDGNTVVTALPPDPNFALNPYPPNGSKNVELDVVLHWTPGINATSHDVYFGTNWDDVNDANSAAHPNVDFNTVDVNYSDPCGAQDLEFSTTYYWRIDANNSGTLWKGKVWHFTTRSPIVDPNLLVWYKFDEPNGFVVHDSSGRAYDGALYGPEYLWDPNNGHDGGCRGFDLATDADRTVVQVPTAALSEIDGEITISVWLKDSVRSEDNWVCDTGVGGEGGPFHVAVVLPTDAGDLLWRAGGDTNDVLRWDLGGRTAAGIIGWHHWAFVKDEGQSKMSVYFDGELATEQSGTFNTLANVQGAPFKIGSCTWENYEYIGKIDDFRVYDRALSEGRIASIYRGGDLGLAWAPDPYDGELDVPRDANLVWKQGDYVASHDVYIGTNWDDVNDVNSSNLAGYPNVEYNNVTVTEYEPGLLDLGQTYYWRIDEVNGPNTWTGPVWSFTVAEYIIIDDMEEYTESWTEYPISYLTGSYGWDCGFTNGSGSSLGLELASPTRGEKSMVYSYDNDSPYYYSEISNHFTMDPCDWTDFDRKILTLWFYGDPANAAGSNEQMYLGVEDSDSDYAEVRYPMEDMNDVKLAEWQEWNTVLSSLTAANPSLDITRVEKLYIGFGDRNNSSIIGLGGFVYLDDIRLYGGRCFPSLVELEADLNNDCTVDYGDIEIMATEWLETDINLGQVQEPCDANLIGWWKLDEFGGNIATDYAGYDNNGVLEVMDINVSWLAEGYDGNALEFSGGRVRVPDAPQLRPAKRLTVCAWINYYQQQNSARIVVKGGDNVETYGLEVNNEDELVFHIRDANNPDDNRYGVDSNDPLDHYEWVHVAGTYDGTNVRCYVNGQLKGSRDDANAITTLCQDTNDLAIGNRSDEDNRAFLGSIDDVRLYNYALSQEQIAYLAADGNTIFSVHSAANLYDQDPLGFGAVNLKDFAVLADAWLDVKLWPE